MAIFTNLTISLSRTDFRDPKVENLKELILYTYHTKSGIREKILRQIHRIRIPIENRKLQYNKKNAMIIIKTLSKSRTLSINKNMEMPKRKHVYNDKINIITQTLFTFHSSYYITTLTPPTVLLRQQLVPNQLPAAVITAEIQRG